MKKLLVLIFLFLLIISCGPTNSNNGSNWTPSKKERFYDDKGRYQGHSETTSYGRIRYYDEKGRYKGYSETCDGVTRYYDERGNYKGSSNN